MIALVAMLVLAQPAEFEPILTPCSDEDPCDPNDGPRLLVTLANQKERAEKAEKIGDLERSARIAAERLAQNEHERAEDWKQAAQNAAYRPWYDQPVVFFSGGVATGIILTVAIVAIAH